MSAEAKLKELGLTLTQAPSPVAQYVPAKQVGNLIYVSGQVPFRNGKLEYMGKVGAERTPEEGKKAAELCALNALAVVKSLIGSLDKVEEIVQVRGFVNCTPEFTNHPEVINGASDLFVNVFGEKGRHVRAALGAPSLPRGATTEVEIIVRVK
ncbi:RidA family protein [Candidatus Acetothermia bacterium]|nr:RidA family protein [Candidatus Acetothermia bacterium]MBI3643116.1 RidA family protein [Candidatus Acetothermia bacterium]